MNVAFPLGHSLLAAAMVIAAAAALAWLAPAPISTELSHRLLDVLRGAVVVVYSNAVPKALASHARLRCSPAAEQPARRFAGWSLVLGGIGRIGAAMFTGAFLVVGVAGMFSLDAKYAKRAPQQ